MGYDEKSASADVETASPNKANNNGDILTPLLLLLAARRGFQRDSNIDKVAVSDGYYITFRGQSGVKAVNHSSLFVRFVCALGHISKGALLSFLMSTFFITELVLKVTYGESEGSKSYRWRWAVALVVAAVECLLFIMARIYAKHHAAAATPPWCDPDSYQCRLSAAMAKANIQYADIVSATLAEMDKLWKSEQALCERFRIEGLVDPEDRRLVYDVVMRFYNNGFVIMQFPSAEKVPTSKPGIVIGKVVEEKP